MKIRVRLTWWYFSITMVLLIAFSLGIYFTMQQMLYNSIDTELAFVAEAVEQSYNAQLDTFDIAFHDTEAVNPLLSYHIVVYDRQQDTVYESPLAKQLSLEIPFSPSLDSEEVISQIEMPHSSALLPTVEPGTMVFRTLNRQVFSAGQPVGWVSVAISIEHLERSLKKLFHSILVGIAISGIFVFAIGYMLTNKALSPVDVITRRARQISSSTLDERIDGVESDDELGYLAQTLNNLIDRLEKSFKSQQFFMADVAHELKTPLSVLRAHWEEELNNSKLSIEIKEKLVKDVEMITRLSRLINDLLLLTQTENVRQNFEYTKVNLGEIIQDVVSDVSVLAEMKEQQIEQELEPGVILQGDSNRLYQLFFNLLENAVKYSSIGGKISIKLKADDGYAITSVQDDGPGIPEKDLPHIFDRFYRVKTDRARSTGGSGLGLSICKFIAEVHGGYIRVESTEGKGTKFTVFFLLQSIKS